MRRVLSCSTVLCLVVSFSPFLSAQETATAIADPTTFFGFTPGDDRKLFDYEQLVDYLEQAAAASPRVEIEEIGRTTLDRPMMLLFISAAGNIERLDELKEVNRRLALDPAIPDDDRQALIETARVFVMATLSMHSGEVAPAQTLPLLVHELATGDDPETLGWLDDVVLMVVACLNPDGMDMMVHHYWESLGTAYEGGSMPGLYHHFVGHDNNRDFVALTQAESRAVSRVYSTEWYPQVLVDKHQMGRTGPRYFVPEYHDPIALNIDHRLWTWTDVFGTAMAREMGESGLLGVASHWVFDDYWPGSTTTSHWKGVISILTEAASARLATPVYIERNERRVNGKGLAEYKKSVNMPAPWPGGWWRLGDIVGYELASWRGILDTASLQRTDILSLRNDLCRDEVETGRVQAPFYYIVPADQHDTGEFRHLADLLTEHGVEVAQLTGPVTIAGRSFAAGDLVVPLAQPYRAFIKEVMERQRYPVRRYTPGGEVVRPYDITSWSLPLHLGLTSFEIDSRSEELESMLGPFAAAAAPPAVSGEAWGVALDPRDNANYRVVFEALARGIDVQRADAGLSAGDTPLPPGSFVITSPPSDLMGSAPGARSYLLDRRPETGLREISMPRIALIETWFHDMDAGWTRYLLESYGVPYVLLRPGEVPETDLAAKFDVVVFPDADKDVLTEGKYKAGDDYRVNDYRPQYTKGLTDEGIDRIEAFLEAGGVVVSWGRSTGLFFGGLTLGEGEDAMEVELPVEDDAEKFEERGLFVPGSLLAVELVGDDPLTWGMPSVIGVFSRGRPVLQTRPPMLVTDRRVIGTFPEEDILLSGYAEEVELLAERPAMVWTRAGRGQLVLFGFQPQFRASTPTTFKLIFNALLLPKVERFEAGVAGVSE
jgi:hypothetical protein